MDRRRWSFALVGVAAARFGDETSSGLPASRRSRGPSSTARPRSRARRTRRQILDALVKRARAQVVAA
jgi:hypothetical protein